MKLKTSLAALKSKKGFWAGLFLALLALGSCKYEYFDPNRISTDGDYQGDWAIPLAHSTLTVDDILARFDNDEIVQIDPNGKLALVYRSTLFSIPADSLITLPDQTINTPPLMLLPGQITQLESSGSITPPPSTPFTYTYTTTGGVQITSVTFKGGTLTYRINNNIPHGGNMVISIPGLKDASNVSYSKTVNFVPSANNQIFTDNLTGWTLDMSNGGTTSNQINGTITFNFQDSGGSATSLQTITVAMELDTLKFSKIFGDFGSTGVATGPSDVRIRIFDNTSSGHIYFNDPKLTAYFYNGFGAGIRVNFNQLDAFIPALGTTTAITGYPNPLNLLSAPAIGTTSLDTFQLNNTNSNINTCLDLSTTILNYDINALMNPGAGPHNNFALDTSRLRLDVKVELPLDGTAQDFLEVDTFDFALPDTMNEANLIAWVNIRMITENKFPCDGHAQVYLADSNYVVVDSLISNPADAFIQSAPIDGNGRSTGVTKKILDITKTSAEIKNWANLKVRKLLVYGLIETTNQGNTNVKIYNDYTMDIRLGMRVKFDASKSDIDSLIK